MLKDALTLSALIAAVLLVRAAFKNRVPKRLLYALWLVVLLKLCLPGTAYALPLLPGSRQQRYSRPKHRRSPRPLRSSPRRPLRSRRRPRSSPPPNRRRRQNRRQRCRS